MLDYEIIGYKVVYRRKGEPSTTACSFGTEKSAIEFVKESRDKWAEYQIVKTQAAIIDF